MGRLARGAVHLPSTNLAGGEAAGERTLAPALPRTPTVAGRLARVGEDASDSGIGEPRARDASEMESARSKSLAEVEQKRTGCCGPL